MGAYNLWTSLIDLSSCFLVFFSHLVQTRKSYEFEDLLQSSSENSRVDWYAQTKLGLTRTLSEENVYEDILGKRPTYLCMSPGLSLARGRGNGADPLKHRHTHTHTHTHTESRRNTCTQMNKRAGRGVGEWPTEGHMRESGTGEERGRTGAEWPWRQHVAVGNTGDLGSE